MRRGGGGAPVQTLMVSGRTEMSCGAANGHLQRIRVAGRGPDNRRLAARGSDC